LASLTGKGVAAVEDAAVEDEQEEQEALERGVLTQLQEKRSPIKKRRILTIAQLRKKNKKDNNK
jgi:hypothetical protein